MTMKKKLQRRIFAQVQMKNATLKIKDGASAVLTVKIGSGDITWNEKKNIEYIPDRGLLDEVREGDEIPLEISFTLAWTLIRASGTGTAATGTSGTGGSDLIESILRGGGTFVSTDDDPCRPYAVDLELTILPPCSGGGKVYTFPDFRVEDMGHGVRAGQITVSGKCNVTAPTITDPA